MNRTEGIICHALPFRDYDQILTLFSIDLGLVSVFIKNALRAKKKQTSASPLTRCEIIYQQGKGEMLLCSEIVIIDQFIGLRKELAAIETACHLLRLIRQSQLPGKPAPELYLLLIKYLNAIVKFNDLGPLCASFELKLLRHEGRFHFSTHCQQCRAPLTALHFSDGDTFCQAHAPEEAIPFSAEEISLIHSLAYCRSLSELKGKTVTLDLKDKLRRLFDS